MAEIRFTILSEPEKRRIIDEAFGLVATVGVKVEGDSLRDKLRRAGARADEPSGRVTMPREMAEEHLAQVPRVCRLETIDGRAIRCGDGDRRRVSLVLDPVIVDHAEGPRAPRLSDVAAHARIGDALPLVNTIYKMDQGVSDVPIDRVNATTLYEFLCNTTQCVTGNPADMDSARLWVEMLQVILGADDFRARPIASFGSHVTSPFRLGALECELLEFLAAQWLPTSGGACPMAGATSPFTLAGTLLQCLAETIFHIATAQVLQPGLPMMAGSSVFAFNMRAGDVTAGGVETTLMDAAYIELCHELGLPTSGCIGFADPPALDVQLGAEAAIASLAMVLARADSLNGLGTIGNAAGVSPEKIVIDHDLLEMAGRFRQGVRVDDETLALDAIRQVAQGGDFMARAETIAQLRTGEHYYGGSFGRGGPDHFSKPMLERAHERVLEIIETHEPAVPDKTRQELARLARKHGAQVG
ncbi:MAG: trimethylamine methyltransferase family protein [Phycisphaerae bacterium]|nr:trimethylamine methyltransferase family protein [Phycisphaerae bacterium]